jgi:hypothetical protein
MARLTHTSKKAFKRLIQMSSSEVFIFVEGQSDRYFYDKICEKTFRAKKIKYVICLAQELPDNAGGKQALLKYFKFLNRTNSLVDEFKEKKTISVFCLDKDIDDIQKKCKSSEHIIYTEYYHMENYFFENGDIVEALAAATSLDLNTVRLRLGNNNIAWRKRAAENWKDWVKLCVYSKKKKINYDCNYRLASQINEPYASVDLPSYENKLLNLEHKSGLSNAGFKRSFAYVSRLVDELYDNNNFDSVFKGVWYISFLIVDAKNIAGGRAYESQALHQKLIATIKLTLDFDKGWTEQFKDKLIVLSNKL